MKKTFRMMGLAVMALVMSLAMQSCKDDELSIEQKYEGIPFTVTALEQTLVRMSAYDNSDDTKVSYKLAQFNLLYSKDNGKTWEKYDDVYLELLKGQSVMFKAGTEEDASVVNDCDFDVYNFRLECMPLRGDGAVEVSGNVMYLLNGMNPGRELEFTTYGREFRRLFYKNTYLKNAKNLLVPANLNHGTFYETFAGCSALKEAPELPATQLASQCYYSMFDGCASLVNAPVLPATMLNADCYNGMFKKCQLLETVETKATNVSAGNCLKDFLSGAGVYADKRVWYVPKEMVDNASIKANAGLYTVTGK